MLLCSVTVMVTPMFQEKLDPDMDGAPRRSADIPQRPKVCSPGRLGAVSVLRIEEVVFCLCAKVNLLNFKCKVFSFHAAEYFCSSF